MNRALIVIAIFFMGCEVVVDVDMPIKPASITVNSVINPDSLVEVYLFTSQHVLSEGQFPPLEGATVNLFEDEEHVETLTEVKNRADFTFYKGQTTPKPGHAYRLEVSKNQFNTVQAETVLPYCTATLSELAYRESKRDEFSHGEYTFTVTINDQPGSNYYQVGLYVPYFIFQHNQETGENVITDTIYSQHYLQSEDPIFSDVGYFEQGLTFSDALFEGKSVKISFNTFLPYYYDIQVTEIEVIVTLKEISEPLFNYQTTAALQNNLEGDPFAEPVPVFNNVENGYGVFGGYSQKSYPMTVEFTF